MREIIQNHDQGRQEAWGIAVKVLFMDAGRGIPGRERDEAIWHTDKKERDDMGFLVDKDRNNQQRIGLSRHADDIVQNDCTMFGCLNKEGVPAYHTFVNKIFCSFYQQSEVSVERRIHEKRAKLGRIRGDEDAESLRRFEDKILEAYREELNQRVRELLSRECVCSKVISLNGETLRILKDSEESKAYSEKRASRYVRAVLEDYAASDFLTRKKIYYRDMIEEIQGFIDSGSVIRFRRLGAEEEYIVKPAFFRADQYETHLYLAALVCGEKGEGRCASYRIDKIDQKSLQCVYKSPISAAALAELEKTVDSVRIQYLSNEADVTHVRIRLSPEGIRRYRQWTFQRPMYSGIEGEKKDIYVFDIPYYQAIVYFFKFGQDAVVLEPDSLRERFRRMYEEALGAYGGWQEREGELSV